MKDSELEMLWLLKKHGKLRWEDLVEKSSYSRRWVHKNLQGLMEGGFIKKEQDKSSNEYPLPVYYSIENFPPEVKAQLDWFEATKQFLEPINRYQRIIEEFTSTLRTFQEVSLFYENAAKAFDDVGKLFVEMNSLIEDLKKAVDSGELPKEILKAPIDEAMRIFLTYKVKKGELPHEILKLPLREAIQKYRSQAR